MCREPWILVGGLILAACSGGAKRVTPDHAGAVVAPSAVVLAPYRALAVDPGLVNQELVKRGYVVQNRRGQVVYCRAEAITGSRLTSQVCRSEQAIKEDELRARDILNRGSMNRYCPPGLSCNSNN